MITPQSGASPHRKMAAAPKLVIAPRPQIKQRPNSGTRPVTFSNQSLEDFKTAQKLREQHEVRGMLTLNTEPPHEIRLQFCQEIWEMPQKFIAGMSQLKVPTFIRTTPIEHIPYTLEWIATTIGQHLMAIWKNSRPLSAEKEFLGRVISLLHFPEVHEPITQEELPACENEAFQRWNQIHHPIHQTVKLCG